MPWVEKEERHDKVECIGRGHADHEVDEETVLEDYLNSNVRMCCELCFDGSHCDENCRKHQVCHDENPEVYHCHVQLVRTLRSITKREYET